MGSGGSGTGRVVIAGGTAHHTACTVYNAQIANTVQGLPSTDGEPYLQAQSVDANLHQSAAYTDARGKAAYTQRFTGSGQLPDSGVTSYALTSYQYDATGTLRRTTEPNGSLSSVTTDALGRTTSIADPDLGSWSYAYDANGNLLQSSDPRGASGGTIYAGYDGLNRQLWRNTSNSPTNAYVSYTYDSVASGNDGVGRLTGESFNPGTSGAGSYAYVYDTRGRQTKRTITLGGVAYPLSTQYNDAGLMTRFTYSDSEVLAVAYTNSGWLSAIGSTPAGKGQTLLASSYTFTGAAGFSGVATGATIAGYYTYAATYDNDLRLTNATYKLKSSGAVYYSASRGYDGVGNVVSTATTLTSGTDNQAFCYDEQNRLVWASATTGTPPCGGSLTGGTLTTAQYTASYSYDTLGRLTSAPLGGYTYGDASHLDAATSVGSAYTASYDAAGDMTCRAPSSSVTCAGGTPTGSVMTYDNERRLATWQNTPSNPTSTASYWYDGEGQRVAQTLNGVTTYYIGSDEEITGSTLLKYYHIPGLPVLGTITGVTRTYLASDGLGSETVDLSYNGSVLATALYGPYGVGRYATGTMPTSRGYTGQRQDSGSGLDYYGARYYDALVGQFTSADSAQGPNRYAYVGGNPETATDPTGKRLCDDDGSQCGRGLTGGGVGDYCNRLLCPSGGTNPAPPSSRTTPPKPHIDCNASARICGDINAEFHDSRTQLLLDALTYSDIGMKFLVFLLAVGAQTGDYYISWGTNGTNTDNWGNIHLDVSALPNASDPNALADIIGYAGGLIHEAVESYYALADGIQSYASLHMDYTAQWFAGEARQEMAGAFGIDMSNVPGTDSYRESYADWVNSPDGQTYVSLGEQPNQPEVTDRWGSIWSWFAADSSWQRYDAMGLTESTLTSSYI